MTDPTPGPDAPTEPLLSVGTVTAAAVALIAMLVSFGVPLDDDQQAAILGVIAVLAPIAVAAAGRGRVWSPASVREKILEVEQTGRHSR